jgi:flagellar basal-body rod modification protein FlgD
MYIQKLAASGASSSFYSSLVANSATSTTSTAASATTGTGAAGGLGSSQDLAQTFLTLLVAQMNNQDPLNPVDNNQLTTQMAQISTVTGINNLNGSVQSLLTQLQQSATMQSAQLTGHSVMVAGSALPLAANSGSSTGVSAVGGFSLAGAASNVTVNVLNSSGQTVQTLNLGAMSSGFQDFTWDGSTAAGSTAAAGSYTFQVSATASNGSGVGATAYNLLSIVGTVPQSNGTLNLMLSNGTQVPYSAVQQII